MYESIDVNDQIALLGEVTHYVDEFIVIRSTMDTSTVDIDSVLCLEDRTVLGRVSTTLTWFMNDDTDHVTGARDIWTRGQSALLCAHDTTRDTCQRGTRTRDTYQ